MLTRTRSGLRTRRSGLLTRSASDSNRGTKMGGGPPAPSDSGERTCQLGATSEGGHRGNPSPLSESAIRVHYPSPLSESAIRVRYPSPLLAGLRRRGIATMRFAATLSGLWPSSEQTAGISIAS